MIVFVLALFTGCSSKSLKKAEFTNTTPASVAIDGLKYTLTDEILSSDDLGKQIGKITKYNAIVSYADGHEPYKNPDKIYEVKGVKAEEAVAVEVNEKLYKAKIEK